MADPVHSILAVTSEVPWPLDTGGHLRTFHLLRSLAKRFRLRLATPALDEQAEAIAALEERGIAVAPVRVRPRVAWREALRAARSELRGEPYVLYGRHDRGPVRAALRRAIRDERPDVFYLDHLDSAVYLKERSGVPVVLDLHNVYSILAARSAEEDRRGLARAFLRREAKLLARAERSAVQNVDAVFTVSDLDAEHFRTLGSRNVHVVPNGVDCAAYESLPTGRSGLPPCLTYIGAMSWPPNVQAARFLATRVLPTVRERIPDVKLRIVGRNPTHETVELNNLPGVEVTGGVPEIMPYLREASMLAVPLEAGGGTRLKILEAFAAGLPVVSSPVGCEGIACENEKHLLVADLDKFAEATLSLLSDPTLGDRLATQARMLAVGKYDWTAVGESACRAILDLPRTAKS